MYLFNAPLNKQWVGFQKLHCRDAIPGQISIRQITKTRESVPSQRQKLDSRKGLLR